MYYFYNSEATSEETSVMAQGACGAQAGYMMYSNGAMIIMGHGEVTLNGVSGLENVTKVWVDRGITALSDYCFDRCVNLQEVHLPDTLETIGRYAFFHCKKLPELVLPKGVKSIVEPAFVCGGQTKVSVAPDNAYYYAIGQALVEKNGDKMVHYTSCGEDSYTVPEGIKAIGDEVFFRKGLKNITFPEGVEMFDYYCMSSAQELESVTFPSTTKAIYEGVVDGCWKLGRIVCLATVPPATAEYQTFSDLNGKDGQMSDWFDTPLFVPKSAIEDYKSDSEWGQFKDIRAIEDME